MEIINDLNPLSNWLVNEIQSGYDGGKYFLTSSTYPQSIRKIVLAKRYGHEFKANASELFKMSLGTLQHDWITNRIKDSFSDKVICEERMEFEIAGEILAGKQDLYIKEDVPVLNLKAGTLVDLKTANSGTWIYNDDNFKRYADQLRFNAYALERNGHRVNKIAVLWFVFTDWTTYQAEYKDGYPQPSELVDIEYDKDLTEHDIQGKVEKIKLAMELEDHELDDCLPSDTWEKPPWKVYKLKKNGEPYAKAMSFGSFYSEAEAKNFSSQQKEQTVVQYKKELDRKGCQSCFCRFNCEYGGA
jgi:hypothetical protein